MRSCSVQIDPTKSPVTKPLMLIEILLSAWFLAIAAVTLCEVRSPITEQAPPPAKSQRADEGKPPSHIAPA